MRPVLVDGPRLRVGLLAPPWLPVPPVGYGGTEGVIDRLARGLTAAGHDVRLWSTGDATCPVPTGWVEPRAARVAMGTSAAELRHVLMGYEWFAGHDVDLIHDHTLAGPAVAAGRARVPVVATNHGPFTDGVMGEIYRRAGVPVVAISHHHARGARMPVAAVIHHGLDVDDVLVGAGDGDARGRYLLFLGRMAPEKGAHRAARIARAAGWRLLIAARCRGPEEERYLAEEVEPLLGDGIEHIGEVGGARKAQLLAGAAALLNPIRWPEPFGLAMAEALAAGTPVLAFPEGAAPEIVEHGRTGFLAPDEAGLADAVGRIDQLDRRACRAAARDRFSTARMVDDHVALYRSVLATASGGRRAQEGWVVGVSGSGHSPPPASLPGPTVC